VTEAPKETTPKRNLHERIRARFEPVGGIDLDLPPREPVRDPPSLDIGQTVLEVYDLRRTCIACPSQWEGRINDCGSIYIRYRWGTLTARVSMADANAVRADTCLYEDDIGLRTGDRLGGYMDTGEMREALAHVCRFTNQAHKYVAL
jgi:hypothetical protein